MGPKKPNYSMNFVPGTMILALKSMKILVCSCLKANFSSLFTGECYLQKWIEIDPRHKKNLSIYRIFNVEYRFWVQNFYRYVFLNYIWANFQFLVLGGSYPPKWLKIEHQIKRSYKLAEFLTLEHYSVFKGFNWHVLLNCTR